MKNRDPERLINAVRMMYERCPDLRVGQIIVNAMEHNGRGNDPFYIENDDLAALIEAQVRAYEKGGL